QVVSEKGNGVVVHPEYTVSHGACHLLGRSVDQLSEDYPVESCFKHHPWVSVAVAEKAVFQELPYLETRVGKSGFGYEELD
ncbi:glycosyltransferase family 2 protein, partial [Pseudomonas aeruginosa]